MQHDVTKSLQREVEEKTETVIKMTAEVEVIENETKARNDNFSKYHIDKLEGTI